MELAAAIDATLPNLPILYANDARAIRFSALHAIGEMLN